MIAFVAHRAAPAVAQQQPAEWTAYGRDAQGTRYSPLPQIDRANVASSLSRGPIAPARPSTPISRRSSRRRRSIVDGVMYLSTPLGRAIALDPATGTRAVALRSKRRPRRRWGDFASRGVSTWVDSTRRVGLPCRRRIYLPTIDARLIALDARNGRRLRGVRRSRLARPAARTAQRAIRDRGIRADVAAGDHQRAARHRLVGRRQQSHRRRERRSARVRRPHRRAEMDVGSRSARLDRPRMVELALDRWRTAPARRTRGP